MEHINKETAVAIGKFDGLHIGHRALLSALCDAACKNGLDTIVFSFSPPPAVYFSGAAVKSIYTADEKKDILNGLGIRFAEYPFEELADMRPRPFIEDVLYKKFRCRALAAGENFRFGKDRAGDISSLNSICGELGIKFIKTPLIKIDGNAASSTSVINLLNNGDIEGANVLLGRPYSIAGIVRDGKRIGRTLGFPTVNIPVPPEKFTPKDGVYVTGAEIGNAELPGVTNVGVNPTFGAGGEKKCETFLLDFDKNVYGEKIKINFYKYIRAEVKFGSAELLKTQISEDAAAAELFFKNKYILKGGWQMDKLAVNGGPRTVPEDVKFLIWPEYTQSDHDYVTASLNQNNHAWGPNCVKLGEEWSAWNGNAYTLATNSGTAALHMCLAACGVGPGDEVITTTTSWTSTATCILHHNAIPVFCDIEWDTMLMDPNKLEQLITKRTKAIIAVHYWGLPCDMDAVNAIAKKHNLYVIEDACQAHGSVYKGKKVGTLGHCGAFSLNQNKNFSAGEGGLFVTDDEEIMVSARALMSFGEMSAPEEKRTFHSYQMGWMYRINDLTAALARSQLTQLDKFNAAALKNFNGLKNALIGAPALELPVNNEKQTTNGYAFVIRVKPEQAGVTAGLSAVRDAVANALRAEGVPVSPVRWLLPAHTVIRAKNGYGNGCPWTCHLYDNEVNYDLDQYPVSIKNMDASIQIDINGHRPPNGDVQIKYIAEGIKKVFSQLADVPVV